MEYFANSDEPGYVYLMTFNKNGSVTISGKNKWIGYLNGEARSTPVFGSETSLWDVITDNGPVLTFNTYNRYFHLFSDPENIPDLTEEDPDETGYGHEGDYEFDLMKYTTGDTGDTVFVTGKKYGLEMIMTRINADTTSSTYMDDRAYMDYVVALADSFFHAKVPQVYINMPDGNPRWIVKNGATSILKMFREDQDEISTSETHNVIITPGGLSFMNPITLDGYVIKTFVLQQDGSLVCRENPSITMTADELSTIFSNTKLKWRLDLSKLGGKYATLKSQLDSELSSSTWKSSLSYVEMVYNSSQKKFAVTFLNKYRSTTYKPTYYLTMEPVGDNQIVFDVDTEGDAWGKQFVEKCPSLKALLEAMGSVTYDLSATSLLAPVHMTLAESSDNSNFMVWNIQ